MRLFRQVPRITANIVLFTLRLAQFLAILFAFYLLYDLLLDEFLDGSNQIYPLLGLWLVSAYVVIPRIHRALTNYYLPNYFVGRIRSPSGFLSDPVNLAFIGSEKNLHKAMQNSGWEPADALTAMTLAKTAYATLFRKSYPTAPVGSMFLFNRRQNFAYQQQVGGSPNTRHHIRFWRTPKKWYLPGGRTADWLAAATYDTHVGLKLATGQIDHLIHEDIDAERDYIIKTLQEAKAIKKLDIVKHFTDAYHDRSNGGDRIKTDGSLPFIEL